MRPGVNQIAAALVGATAAVGATMALGSQRDSHWYFGDPVVAGLSLGAANYPGGDMAIGDLDLDGFPDVVIAGEIDLTGDGAPDRALLFWKNDGFGNFALEAARNTSGFYDHEAIETFAIADINGDGVPEIILADKGQAASPPELRIVVLSNALAPWQPAPERAADFDGNQTVDGADLAFLLGAWGPVTPQE